MEIETLLQHLSKWGDACPETRILSRPCDVEEVASPGQVNHVWRIRNRENPNETLIAKYAPPYMKAIGKDRVLTVERLEIEFRALRKINELHDGCAPKPYVFDKKHSLVVMEDLYGYKNMRKAFISGEFDIKAVQKTAVALATLHRKTHRQTVTETEFEELFEVWRQNDDMVNVLYDYVYTAPFNDHSTNKPSDDIKKHLSRVFDDKILQENVVKLRTKYQEDKECLVHGDFNSDAIMVNKGSAKIFDPEYARIGPPACDVGMLLANFISYYSHKLYPSEKAPEFYNNLKKAFEVTLSIYLKSLWEYVSDVEIKSTISNIAGFTGVEFVRWIIGLSCEADLEGRPLAEVKCLDVAILLVQRYTEITDEQQFINCVFN